jgi:predicted nucleic acid-binding protein
MIYVDTSVIVAALTSEPATDAAQRWIAGQAADAFISDWVIAEFSAALSVKLRTGALTLEERADALATFRGLSANSWEVLRVTSAHFQTAARLADDHPSGLRAGDALHLAIALDHGAKLCTLDRRLSRAGLDCGVASTTW